MRRIEEGNKFELVLSIKALVALALADEMIEGGEESVEWASCRQCAARGQNRPRAMATQNQWRRPFCPLSIDWLFAICARAHRSWKLPTPSAP
jgi:hypothetical protein